MRIMQDQICLITGANSGIGKVTARELAKKGAHIIMLCRNSDKAEKAKEDILKVCGHDKVDIVLADLSSTKEIYHAADHIRQTYPKIDILLNNAGMIMGNNRQVSKDGIEMTLAVNHLAPFLLTSLLLDKVKESSKGRIITVSSEAHRIARINFDNLQLEKGYSGLKAYALSKLCNILFTKELSSRLEGSGIAVNTLHPGAIASNFGKDHNNGGFFKLVMSLSRPFFISTEEGAQTSIYLCVSQQGALAHGQYFKNKKPVLPSKTAQHSYNARRLWEVSEDMLNIQFAPSLANA